MYSHLRLYITLSIIAGHYVYLVCINVYITHVFVFSRAIQFHGPKSFYILICSHPAIPSRCMNIFRTQLVTPWSFLQAYYYHMVFPPLPMRLRRRNLCNLIVHVILESERMRRCSDFLSWSFSSNKGVVVCRRAHWILDALPHCSLGVIANCHSSPL